MRERIVVAALVAAGFVCALGAEAKAQSLDRKIEVGVLGTAVTSSGSNGTGGVGGRAAYNFNDHVALEVEVNVFPDGPSNQQFFGLKAGTRSERFGVFAKARPGVISANDTKSLQFDLGGIFEFYPTERTILRVDIGDTMTRPGGDRVHHFLQASVGFGWRF